jgi:hypothetical protein
MFVNTVEFISDGDFEGIASEKPIKSTITLTVPVSGEDWGINGC